MRFFQYALLVLATFLSGGALLLANVPNDEALADRQLELGFLIWSPPVIGYDYVAMVSIATLAIAVWIVASGNNIFRDSLKVVAGLSVTTALVLLLYGHPTADRWELVTGPPGTLFFRDFAGVWANAVCLALALMGSVLALKRRTARDVEFRFARSDIWIALLALASFVVIAASWWVSIWVSGDALFLLAIIAVLLFFRARGSRRIEGIAAACVFVVWTAAYLFMTRGYVSFEAVLPSWSIGDQWPSVLGWLLTGSLIGFLAAMSLIAMGSLVRQVAKSGIGAESHQPVSPE